jgi:hypothetical protein
MRSLSKKCFQKSISSWTRYERAKVRMGTKSLDIIRCSTNLK